MLVWVFSVHRCLNTPRGHLCLFGTFRRTQEPLLFLLFLVEPKVMVLGLNPLVKMRYTAFAHISSGHQAQTTLQVSLYETRSPTSSHYSDQIFVHSTHTWSSTTNAHLESLHHMLESKPWEKLLIALWLFSFDRSFFNHPWIYSSFNIFV